jgi:hypothetical protein
MWNAKYHSMQIFLYSCLITKNLKIKIHNIILHVVLHGHGMWSPTSREEHKLKVSDNRMLSRLVGPKRKEIMEG